MSRAFIQKRLPFKPTDIGGCQLWLDGVDPAGTGTPPSNGATVPTWTDKSGSGNSVTLTSSTYSFNSFTGKYGIYFNSNPSSAITLTPYMSFFVSSYWTATFPSNYRGLLGKTPNVFVCGQNDGAGNFMAGILNSTTNVYGSVADARTMVMTDVFYIPSTSFSLLVGCGDLSPTGNPWIGHIYEMIVFNTTLNKVQYQQVESYLAQKWGLRQQLPQGHPGTRGIVYPSDPVNLLVRVPYPSVFSPRSISNCSMWLDGADPVGTGVKPSNGATVSTWVDKSGSGINLTAVGTPTYVSASSAVYLSGGAYMQNTNFNFTNYTIFFVSNQVSDGPLYTNNITTSGNSGFFPRHPNGNYYLVQSDTGWLSAGSPFSDGITYLYSIQYDSLNNINLWSNGSIAPTITGSAGTITRNMFLLGKRNWTYMQDNMTGNIFEVVQYNSDLGQTSRQQVEGYLAWKWGLQANLPANHPYKNASPNITNQFGISRPPNVLPIPPITISARAKYVPTLQTITFTYTGSNQTFTVPSTITPASVTLYIWGAGGGGNTNYGGAGAMVQGILPVTSGETLTIVVGQGGTIDGSTTYGGGGAGAGIYGGTVGIGYTNNGPFPTANAGSGGGRSAIQRGGTDPTNDIVVAGGGGGGTYFSSDRGGAATFSGTANPGTGGLPGLGGTQSAGGAGGGTGTYGQGLGGSRGIGGNTYNNNIYNGGGGGGGGYWGGGGGGTNGGDGAGGGGGSSLTGGLSLISGQSVLGFNSTNGFTAPNTGSSYYQSGVGNGAPAINSSPRAGDNGLIVLTYFS